MTDPQTAIFVTHEEAELVILFRRFLALLRGLLGPSSLDPERVLQLQILQEIRSMSATLDSELAQLKADITAQTTVIASAITAFQGLAAQLRAAEAAALTAGATPEQIAAVTAVRQGVEGNTSALAAAIPANTAGPGATAPPTVTTDAGATVTTDAGGTAPPTVSVGAAAAPDPAAAAPAAAAGDAASPSPSPAPAAAAA